jgi:hypothetical protein
MGRWSCLALCVGLVLSGSSPAAAADLDLAAWAFTLDPDRPASGEYVIYDGGETPSTDTGSALRRSVFAMDPRLAQPAVDTLAEYGVPHGEAVLLELARSERWDAVDADVQVAVLRALRKMRSGRALTLYARVALDGSGRSARESIRALCELLAPEAVPVLRAIAGGRDAKKRNLVVRFLRQTGEREAAKEASQLRKGARKEVRDERRLRQRRLKGR